jgi:hypothetical protein
MLARDCDHSPRAGRRHRCRFASGLAISPFHLIYCHWRRRLQQETPVQPHHREEEPLERRGRGLQQTVVGERHLFNFLEQVCPNEHLGSFGRRGRHT